MPLCTSSCEERLDCSMAGNHVSGDGNDTTGANRRISNCRKRIKSMWRCILETGRENPRRVIHSLKVGSSLALISLLYLLELLFQGVGENAMWAVMTVVVVLEFTAGATLWKGLNRGFGTLSAASLAFFIEYIAQKSGRTSCAVFIGFSVFIIGTTATYMRFIPYIKKNYDYGVLIFLLTFNLITVSSFRVHNVLKLANERLYTIAIGCGLCLTMSLLICPNWSGEDLQKSTVSKLEGLARSIEACAKGYFEDAEAEAIKDTSSEECIYKDYRAVLDSKSSDETLALFASWEPRHSRHCYRSPWQQYVKVGAALRHFGYTAIALQGCLESEIQTPLSVRALFRDSCTRVAGEVVKVLCELAKSIRDRRRCSPNILSDNLQEALLDLNSAINSQPRLFLGSNQVQANNVLPVAAATSIPRPEGNSRLSTPSFTDASDSIGELKDLNQRVLRPSLSKLAVTSLEFSEALPFAAFASLLVEMVVRLEFVIEEVEELGKKARFKEFMGNIDIQIPMCSPNKNKTPKGNVHSGLIMHALE